MTSGIEYKRLLERFSQVYVKEQIDAVPVKSGQAPRLPVDDIHLLHMIPDSVFEVDTFSD